MPQVTQVEPGPNTLRVLLTTDNHVGYNESDPVRGDDSWITFEEIMSIAKEQDVDMVLQSGDLFHINKPTKKSMYHVMKTLRRSCFGDRPCELEMLSDPSDVFEDHFNSVNYEDPNLNISIPVFAISGNHDDASGNGLLSPLDLLSVSGMVNHFGRVTQTDQINVTPILLQKGITKLALYGMASVRDERLFRSFQDKKVKFHRPNVLKDEWFNLMAVHQNHIKRPNTSYLPEHFLPSFLDLVIWGHEHECIPYTVNNPNAGFETLQPGSSVATSLCEGEAIDKKVFILNINHRDYSLEAFKLKTVRPFQMLELSLTTVFELRPGLAYKTEVTQFLISKVEELIQRSQEEWEVDNPNVPLDQMPLPLIRLRVDYSGGYEVENPRRFSNRFVGRLANANSVVQFHKKNESVGGGIGKEKRSSYAPSVASTRDSNVEDVSIETFITNYLKEMELSLLPEKGMNDAVKKFVEKEDKTALKDYIDLELEYEERGFMENENIDLEDNFKTIMKNIKKERDSYSLEDKRQPSSSTKSRSTSAAAVSSNKGLSPLQENEEDYEEAYEDPKRKKKAAPKKPTKANVTKPKPKTGAASRGKKKSEDFVVDSDVEDEEMFSSEEVDAPPPPRATRAPRKATTTTTKQQKQVPTPEVVRSDSDVEDNDYDFDNRRPQRAPPAHPQESIVISSGEEDAVLDELLGDESLSPAPITQTARLPARGKGSRGGKGGSNAAPKRTKKPAELPMTDAISSLLARKKKK